MKYESTILKRLIDTYGVVGNPRYISEIIKEFIVRGKECFPNLFTYQSDWLAHIDEFGLNPSYTVSYTGQSFYAPNTLERPVKSAILKGCTSYRDIDTGEILETFEEGRNLELVSVRMPVLTTSNEDGTKTNILTVNEDVTLRSNGSVYDELDCLTGKLTQKLKTYTVDKDSTLINGGSNSELCQTFIAIKLDDSLKNSPMLLVSDKLPYKLPNCNVANGLGIELKADGRVFIVIPVANYSDIKGWLADNPITFLYPTETPTIKTVDLTILDQNGQNVKQLLSFNGGTHFNTGSLEGSLPPSVSVCVETDLEETLAVCSLEGNTM